MDQAVAAFEEFTRIAREQGLTWEWVTAVEDFDEVVGGGTVAYGGEGDALVLRRG